jgi:hypothetical protein
MTDPDREELVERVVSAYRSRGPDGSLRAHAAWHDLDEDGRALAYRRTVETRRLEAALDPGGLTTTTRAVLAIIRGERVT